MKAEEILIYIISCVLNETGPDPARLADTDFDKVIGFAKFHSLGAIAATGFYRAGSALTAEETGRARSCILTAARRDRLFDAERDEVLRRLEKEKIRYLPLKGAILKNCYPESYLREMADIDILFDPERAEDVREIMKSLGYKTVAYGTRHHDNYMKSPIFNFEMHRSLFGSEVPNGAIPAYYADADRLLKKDPENQYGYHLSPEDFYIHMIAHEYKHYALFGTGLRFLADTYAYLKKYSDQLDWDYVRDELEKLELSDFEKENRILAHKILTEGKTENLTESEREMLKLFSSAGTFGSKENLVVKQVRNAGMRKYIIQRIFLPMESIRRVYPFFYKHKILIPFLPLYRIIHLRRNAAEELRMLREHEYGDQGETIPPGRPEN